jgi:putative transposase
MKQKRRLSSLRLKDFDYSEEGIYFITICTKDRKNFFGKIQNGKMMLNDVGEIAKKCWKEIPKYFPDTVLGTFVIMPNHVHGLIYIKENNNSSVRNENFRSLPPGWHGAKSRSLSSIIRGFKIGVTKWCRQNNHDYFSWHKSFYDHIVRNDEELEKIHEYIIFNPQKWELDKYFSTK